MEMARRWRVSAKSMSGKAIDVYVSQKEWSGDVVAVEAAANMIEWADDDDRDVLLPVRGQSGYLRVVDDGSGEVEQMMPRNNMEHYVEVLRDGVLVWQGYMQAATYTAAWDIAPKVVEFPLIDGLTALESVYMDGTKEMRLTTLGELVHEALTATGVDVQRVVYPKEVRVSESDAAGYAAPWLMEVSRFNFFEKSDAVNYDDPEYQRYDGITYKELLEEVCKLWGWRLVMRGWEALFLSTEAEGYVRMALAGLKNAGTATTEEVAVTSQELAGLDWMSTDHTIERLQGCNKVAVTGKVKAVGEVLPAVDVETLDYISEGWGESGIIFGDTGVRERIIQRAARKSDGTAEVRQYESWQGQEVDPDILRPNYATNEGVTGALFVQEDLGTDFSNKKNYNFAGAIRIRIRQTGETPAPTEAESKARPVAILRSYEGVLYDGGVIVLSGSVRGVRYGYFDLDGNIPTKITNGRSMLPVSVRIGDKWWNGNEWQNEEAVFLVRLGSDDDPNTDEGVGKICNTKTIEMPYEGADGYLMEIKDKLWGNTEIVLYAPWQNGISDMILLENFAVKFVDKTSRQKKKKEGDNVYRAILVNGFKNEKSVELLMTTEKDNPSAYSILTYKGENVQELQFIDDMMRPEEALLGKLKKSYGRIVEALTVDVADDERTGQLMRLQHGGKVYVVLAEAVDPLEERKRVTMIEI